MIPYEAIYSQIIKRLRDGLSPKLTYHNIDHTLDVLQQAERIAAEEKIENEEQLFLLKIACLYHDTGFLFTYRGHEEEGCRLVMEDLPQFGLDQKQIKTICGMIMATQLPQSPKNILGEIICDADLDYLGRNDFEEISNQLRLEFLTFGIVKNYKEWEAKQIDFFESHQYFTSSSNHLRNPVKLMHLEKLKAKQSS